MMISLNSLWARKEGHSQMMPRKSSLKISRSGHLLRLTLPIYLLSLIVKKKRTRTQVRAAGKIFYKRKMESSLRELTRVRTIAVQVSSRVPLGHLLCPLSSLKKRLRNLKLAMEAAVSDKNNNISLLGSTCRQRCSKSIRVNKTEISLRTS